MNSLILVNKIVKIIFDKKGFNLIALDVSLDSSITDYFIVAEGFAKKHVQSIGQSIITFLKKDNKKDDISLINVEGIDDGEWVVLDMFSIIVHLFIPDVREKYKIERLWKGNFIKTIRE